jgi:hypothetical protein
MQFLVDATQALLATETCEFVALDTEPCRLALIKKSLYVPVVTLVNE